MKEKSLFQEAEVEVTRRSQPPSVPFCSDGRGLLRTFYMSVEEEMHNLRVVIKVYLGSLLEFC